MTPDHVRGQAPAHPGAFLRALLAACGVAAWAVIPSAAFSQADARIPAEFAARERVEKPEVLSTLAQLRALKREKNWHFTPVDTEPLSRPLSVLAGAHVPQNFRQEVPAQNAEARRLMARFASKHTVAPQVCNASSASFDWRRSNGVTPVRDQAQCGSCWDFAAHGAFEGNWKITNGAGIDTSEQNTLDCNGGGHCSGGWASQALNYLTKSGSATEQNYPYQAVDQACRVSQTPQPYKAYTWGYVSDSDEVASVDSIKQSLCYHGPLAAGVNATEAFQSYGTDETFDEHNDGSVNHVVTLIGWDDSRHAWLIKNSWGTGWGTTAGLGNERGYMWIDYTSNHIGYGAAWVQAQQASDDNQGNTSIWRIPDPIVNRALTIYDGLQTSPAIAFRAGDKVSLVAGGCVQTGGIGKTWKRYVNPSGKKSDHLYFGSVSIPGLTQGLQPLRTSGCSYDAQRPDQCTINFPGAVVAMIDPEQMFLRLGYADDGYGDNSYLIHDDGTEDQCKGVGNAFLTITVTHAH